MRDEQRNARELKLNVPRDEIDNRGPSAFIRDVHELDACGRIEKLGRKVTKFHPDGTPARATLSVSFKEYRTLRQQLEDPRRVTGQSRE